jgi:YhcN/YlaJ family sporulation lipoprotein
MKIVKAVLSITLISGVLMGCATNRDRNAIDNTNPRPVRYSPTDNVTYNNGRNDVMYNRRDVVDNRRDVVDNGRRDINNVGNNTPNMKVADRVASQVAKLKEVQHANVIVTDSNAYVAVMLKDRSRNEMTSTFKNKITETVKKTDKSIDNVYVSVNPDFYDRMNDYGKELRNGHPVAGLFNQFTDTIHRVFPTSK